MVSDAVKKPSVKSAPLEELTRVNYQAEAAPGSRLRPKSQGWETILLVDDDSVVRQLITVILVDLGYQVTAADNGIAVMDMLQDNLLGPVDLLIVDLVLPQISGGALAKMFQQYRPEAKICFISGYVDQAMADVVLRDQQGSFLKKPFTANALARTVRDLLDR
jgi:two-component system, cell cycle sensor histidine kinase and response regulator CckA